MTASQLPLPAGMDRLPDLPIAEALPPLLAALGRDGQAVLQAPPGAGKTTLVPLVLAASGLAPGRVLMLEPRRLAARAAAARMADLLGEAPGERVGYRVRGETRVGPRGQIEVVTEGILTRMLQDDPELPGVGAVLIDEFHERSLQADLGLALLHEVRGALRADLKLVVMSATLDAGPVAEMLGAPIVTAEGRSHPVDIRWLGRPLPAGQRIEPAVAAQVLAALEETEGGVLVFLPGEAEIRRTAAALEGRLPPEVLLQQLYGALPFERQKAALAPAAPGRRKVVLASAIAETSLTIPDIRVVVDSGLARRARFDPGRGMSSLVTERVSRAEAVQRAGRAGRVAPGVCYRMWTRGAEGGLAPFPAPQIEAGDLTGLALELAEWGADPQDLAFVSPPNPGALAAARALLTDLGALDGDGRITEHGRRIARLPLHPRLAHMVAAGGRGLAGLAALLSDRDPGREMGVDLAARKKLLAPGGPPALRAEARRIAALAGPDRGLSWAAGLALAYPDRIGLRRPGEAPRWLLSGGRGAVMDPGAPLAGERLIVVADLDGAGTESRIRRALAWDEAELRAVMGDRIAWQARAEWDGRAGRVRAVRQERLGALVLAEQPWPDAPEEALAAAVAEGIAALGLNWSAPARRLRARIEWLRTAGHDLPPSDDAHLLATLGDWLLPHLSPLPRSAAEIRALDILPALQARLGWDQMQLVDRLAPARIELPTGRRVAVDYDGDAPEIAVRLQEMFGLREHPIVAGQPLRITLLSPAGRPLQTTTDLPGFWASSYADVRKDMRGRYPRHPWPEDPANAAPTTRAKPRAR